ncbi:MAG: carboxypeptidase-like regulatory domain-containing protein, partial [Thermomicrobiales bacterium]|nr:carboxypeptidase-like regulatory domain-containing protein [Thermomicrobiales bacterium]
MDLATIRSQYVVHYVTGREIMSLRSILRVFAVVAVCLSSIGINPVAAQTSNGNLSVTAARICGDQSLEVRWTDDSIDGISVSLSNTSDEWTSGWIEILDVDAGTFTTPVGRNFDKVVAEVAFSDGSSQQVDIDTGTCANSGDNPDLNWYVTSVTFACDGTITVNMSGSGTSWINFSLFRAGDSQYLTGGVIEPLQAGTVQQGWIDPAAWDPTVAVYASASRGDGGRDTPHPDSEIIRCEAPDPEPESTSITISGQVTDGDGQPINGAEICANVTWEFFYSCVSSARDGSYAINSVPNGEGTLFVQASGYQAQSLEFTAASENITFNPVLRAYTWISISGVVTDENGQTLPGVRVCLSSMASTGFNCTHTTAQGNYKFQVAERENIPPHDLFSGDRNWAFSSDRFTIDTQEIQINLVAVPRETPTENTTPYFGRVVDSDGNPIMQFAACDVGG